MKYLVITPILIVEFFIICIFSIAPIGNAIVIWILTILFYGFGIERYLELKKTKVAPTTKVKKIKKYLLNYYINLGGRSKC
ncbi:hypothetical protein ACLFLF_13880 [Mammaliicoccus sciuri]